MVDILKTDTWALYDICAHFWIPLTCDGLWDQEQPIISSCGISTATLRKTIEEGEEQTTPNPSSRTGTHCARKSAKATRSDCFVDVVTCGVEEPQLWDWLGIEKTIVDPQTGYVCGFEEPVSDEENCGSCSKRTVACRHNLAYMTVHTVCCGDDERHPYWDYGVRVYTSAELELQEEENVYGAGFQTERNFSLKLKKNPNFIDPWSIIGKENADGETVGTYSKYVEKVIKCEDGDDFLEALNVSCSCGNCEFSQIVSTGQQFAAA